MRISAGFRKTALSVVLYACSSLATAQNLGVVGPVYPIAEPDMLQIIHKRLEAMANNGELARIEKNAKARYKAYAERPVGVHLPRARKTRVHYVDPTLTVPYDIEDGQGRVVIPAGTTINPLDYITLSEQLVFFDGDDPAQVVWAHDRLTRDLSHIKPILVDGPIIALMKRWTTRLYFDQRGRLIKRFGIRSVPAVVSQAGRRLKVQEITLKDPLSG